MGHGSSNDNDDNDNNNDKDNSSNDSNINNFAQWCATKESSGCGIRA